MLTPLGLTPSFGLGDRLGLATPGHIAAVTGTQFAPIFAQQSVRENARTGRTPQQVLDDAKRAVEAAGWDAPWGADADHLKSLDDLAAFVQAGYTFFTVDPGAYVDNAADNAPLAVLQEKKSALSHTTDFRSLEVQTSEVLGRLVIPGQDWDEISAEYMGVGGEMGFGAFDAETLLRALVKYGKAIQHTVAMYRHLCTMKEAFDFEVSVDETDSPTSPLEHFFIANELTRQGVRFTSLAPRFIGRFEKGVDYIGDLAALDAEMAKHAAVTAHFGTYKLSLHSGSDKFSVYPLLVKHWGERIHVKTAGTSYLEALRTLATAEPALFERIWELGLERYPQDRATYHVSAEVSQVPVGVPFSALLDDFHAREILHVTFGSALTHFESEIKAALLRHEAAYRANLKVHFKRHLDLLK